MGYNGTFNYIHSVRCTILSIVIAYEVTKQFTVFVLRSHRTQ